MMKRKHVLHLIACAVIFLAAIEASRFSISAQGPNQWAVQDRIPGYDDRVWTPYLIADQNRTVHAFNSDWIEGQLDIVYSQWTLDQGWTEPIDILLPQLKSEARLKGVALDQAGIVHLVFFSGDDLVANIYYSRAPLASAGRAPAWSKPIVIGEKPITPDEAAVVRDSANRLVVLYSGSTSGYGRGLYETHSSDGGATWSEPTPIFLTYSDGLWPTHLQMYVDGHDGVHAVWAVGDTTGNSVAVYHAKRESGQTEWSEPAELARGFDEDSPWEVDTPSIIEYEDELFLIYHDDLPTTRYMLRSSDGGQTWTARVGLFPHVGTNGPAALVIDSNNVLHMFFGNRVGNPATHGMWHSIWQDRVWSPPEAIVSGPGGPGFDPARVQVVASQGNTLLVVWMQEPGQISRGTSNGAWYSYLTVDGPELPIVALPTVSPAPEAIPSPTATRSAPTITPSPERLDFVDYDRSQSTAITTNPAAPLGIGLIPSGLLVVMVIIARQIYRRGPQ